MSRCGYSRAAVHAWLDGEADRQTGAVQAHVDACPACAALAENLAHLRHRLVRATAQAAGDVEPLVALQRIRERMAEEASGGSLARVGRFFADAWAYGRRAVLTSVVGMALLIGALIAVARPPKAASPPLGVRVESLRTPAGHQAQVRQEGDVTLIWVGTETP
jgi:predicted anti-sigma-YlaC factor YlaD